MKCLVTRDFWDLLKEIMVKTVHWLLAISLLLTSPIARGQITSPEMEAAKRIQANVLGVDAHNDTVQRILTENVDIGQHLTDGALDLPRLREGGMHVPFFALWAPSYYHGAEAVRRTLDLRDAMQRVFDKYPDQIELATSAHDVERIAG
jgi:membrane dipeptidase (peptidase family M19)